MNLSRPFFLLRINTIGWTILMVLDLLQSYSRYATVGVEYPWLQNLSFIVPHFLNLWLLAILVYYIWKRFELLPSPMFYSMLFIGGIIFGAFHISLTYFDQIFVLWFLDPSRFSTGFLTSFFDSLISGWPLVLRSFVFYSLIITALVAIDFYTKYNEQYVKSAELETQLSNARLRALKMQLHPHFLFNALNTISMMVRRNQRFKAVEMISGLSDMLRGTLWKSEKQMVPLNDELNLLKKYLDIEQVRFKDNLEVKIDVDDNCLGVLVPNLLLLPIVENAFKHGTTKRIKQSCIKISAQCRNSKMMLSVYNEGPLLPAEFELKNESGTGLTNTLDRLEQTYDSSYSFNIQNRVEGVEVILEIPIVNDKR